MKLLLVFISYGLAYNLAPENNGVFQHPHTSSETYFGYTVALRRNPARLVVGAPRSKSSNVDYQFIREPGAVFSFNLSNKQFQEFVLEENGERKRTDLNYQDLKEGAWIGGSLDVSEHSNHLTVCGSRWANQIHQDYRLLNGVCYLITDDRQPEVEGKKLIPLLDEDHQQFQVNSTSYFLYAYGQAGFSVHFTPEEELLLGAPGVLIWTGTVVKYDIFSSYQPLVPNPYFTEKIQREGYFGYVVSSGQLTTGKRLYVTSAPRGAEYRGQVFIYRFPSTENGTFSIQLTLEGFRIGEYFGASLAVADIDNDGLDDLLVGAPLHSTSRFGDVGAVYFYRNADLWNHKMPLTIIGSNSQGARFGSAIGGLADFDNDGFKDVVIGAPYENKGAVYVYRGSSQGLSSVYSQRITAQEFSLFSLNGFGFSISRALDIDNNFYPDVAVGAYESGHAVVLKTKPVAQLWVRLDRNTRRIHFNTSQLILEACAMYNGKHLPDNLDVKINMTVDKIHRRALFASGNSTSVVNILLTKGYEQCKTQILQVKPTSNWTDTARFAIFPIYLTGAILNSCPLCPIIDPSSNSSAVEKIQIMATCDKEECIPQWKVSAHFFHIMKPVVIGLTKTVILAIDVWNEGDNAHILYVNVDLPFKTQARNKPSFCSQTGNTLSCYAGLLINTNEKKSFEIGVDVSDIDEGVLQANISAHAYDSLNVTKAEAILHAVRILRLDLVGRAEPQIAVVPRNVTRNQTRRITHHYQAYCAGFSPIPNVTLELIAPLMVNERGTWRQIFNYSYTAISGEENIECSWSHLEKNVKRSTDSERILSCEGMDKDIKCVKIVCQGGTLMPGSDGLDLVFRMDVKLSLINMLLKKSPGMYLNTSAIAYSQGNSLTPVQKGMATLLSGIVPEIDDPWFYWYIAFALIVAFAVLFVIVIIFWKWGFFKRMEIPTDTEEDVILYSVQKEEEN